MENTIHPDGTILVLLIENDMMPDLETKEPGSYDIISLFKEDRHTVQSLNRCVNLPIIDNRLIIRPDFNSVAPNSVKIGYCLSG